MLYASTPFAAVTTDAPASSSVSASISRMSRSSSTRRIGPWGTSSGYRACGFVDVGRMPTLPEPRWMHPLPTACRDGLLLGRGLARCPILLHSFPDGLLLRGGHRLPSTARASHGFVR